MKVYYHERADEYDATSYDAAPQEELAVLVGAVSRLPSRRTLDIGCGTGWLARFLHGPLVGLDQSQRMLNHYRRHNPHAAIVRADAPPLPFSDATFHRCFTAHFASHLQTEQRARLWREVRRVGDELIIVEQQPTPEHDGDGWEQRQLGDGRIFEVYKCYRTVRQLATEIDGEVILDTESFAMVRWRRPRTADPSQPVAPTVSPVMLPSASLTVAIGLPPPTSLTGRCTSAPASRSRLRLSLMSSTST